MVARAKENVLIGNQHCTRFSIAVETAADGPVGCIEAVYLRQASVLPSGIRTYRAIVGDVVVETVQDSILRIECQPGRVRATAIIRVGLPKGQISSRPG